MRGGEADAQGTRGELRGKLVFPGVRPVPQQRETQACRPPCHADGAVCGTPSLHCALPPTNFWLETLISASCLCVFC